MHNTGKFLVAVTVVMAMACGSSKESDARAPESTLAGSVANNLTDKFAEEEKKPDDAGGQHNPSAPIPVYERKLIKNGDVSFKTKSLTETKQQIQAALLAVNGYIAKENAYDYSENPSEELTVRVPAKDFDKFLEDVLEGAEELDAKHIDIQDVTEEFVDVEARLKNKKQLEAKYQELLGKANNMDDVLRIEKEISYIREDIESTEGKLKYLSSQVSYSTLQIRYYEKRSSGFNFGGKLGDALKNGGTGFLWFIIIVVQLWPLWIIGACIWWFIVWLIRRSRKNRV